MDNLWYRCSVVQFLPQGMVSYTIDSLRGRRFLGGGLGRVQPSASEASARKFEGREK